MTAPTINGSKYPQPVEALLPAARALAEESDALPSRNQLMRTFRIGASKADAIRSQLRQERDQQQQADQTHAALLARGSIADRPVLFPAEPTPVTQSTPADPGTPAPDEPARPDAQPVTTAPAADASPLPEVAGHPGTNITTTVDPTPSKPAGRVRSWPVLLLALPAFVAIWSGWVGLGGLTGFGTVHPLPGIWDSLSLNTAITLPIGVETYAAYALRAWLSGAVPPRARRFAKWSAIGSLLLGAAGQVAYHLMESAGMTAAPWWITTAVACLPVAVLGMGAALAHLMHDTHSGKDSQ